MSEKKSTTISVGNTPVQRALKNTKRSTLIILFLLGIAASFVYKSYVQEKPVTQPPAATQQR